MNKHQRRPRYRTLREDYVQFCDGNTVAALLLDYLASSERIRGEARQQGELIPAWSAVGGRFGGLITMLRPQPSRETIRRALELLADKGLIEAHPDNGKPTEPNTIPTPNRYRLIVDRLLMLEREWTPGASDAGGDVSVADPPGVSVAHESVVIEEEELSPSPDDADELPAFISPAQRKVIDYPTSAPQPDGGARAYSLIEAWLDAWNITVRRYRDSAHKSQLKGANYLADLQATPDDIAAFVAEKRAKGKQPDEWPLLFIANSFVGWKHRAAAPDLARPAASRVWKEIDV